MVVIMGKCEKCRKVSSLSHLLQFGCIHCESKKHFKNWKKWCLTAGDRKLLKSGKNLALKGEDYGREIEE